jgi:radical SAM protein with 4Fe4S-binding SPASM domain
VSRATGPATDLRLVFWESTAGCNLACLHCRRLEISRALSARDLPTDQAKRLIDGVADIGRPVFVFSGGEPLMRPDIFELAAHAKGRGLPIALATNGTLIDEAMAARIAAAGFDRVSISLDGADAATHDAFRCQQGAFAASVRGFDRLRALGVSMQVNTTMTVHNMGQLDAMYALMACLKPDAWHLFMFVPVGCGLEVPEDQQLAAEEYEAVLRWIADRSAEGRLFIRATCAPQYFRILAQRKELAAVRNTSHLRAMTKGCLAGTGIGFVSHQGDVFPCGYLPANCGNVRSQSFAAIWSGSEVLAALRDPDKLGGKCGACEFRRLCGGCRARAYAATSDMLAEEPCCAYTPQERRPAASPT